MLLRLLLQDGCEVVYDLPAALHAAVIIQRGADGEGEDPVEVLH